MRIRCVVHANESQWALLAGYRLVTPQNWTAVVVMEEPDESLVV